MKRVCTTCERIWDETQLWCKTRTCTAGSLSAVFEYGEYLTDMMIVRMLRVLRTSAIYEAKRGKTRILLKVAHDDCHEQLKREATTLATLAKQSPSPMLPTLLPAFPEANVDQRPYGKTVYQDQTKYYMVMEYIEGEFVRDLLLRNPQPWYQHSAWIVTSVAEIVATIHSKAGKLNLNVQPEGILLRTDRDGLPRPILLDLGICSEPQTVDPVWVKHYAHPAYTAPEVLSGAQPSVTADVHGLGVLFYEMLSGRPPFRFKMRAEDDVRREVMSSAPPQLNRNDLAPDITALVMQAIDPNPQNRPATVQAFGKALISKFGVMPAERKGIRVPRQLIAIGVFATLVVVVLTVLSALVGAASLTPLP